MDQSRWPAEFKCPISMSVMADPVIVSSGQSYERRCIEAWIDLGQQWCVTKGEQLDCHLIVPNVSLKAAILNMAKSRGLSRLPRPPSHEKASELARRLLEEISQTKLWDDESWLDAHDDVERASAEKLGSQGLKEAEDLHRISERNHKYRGSARMQSFQDEEEWDEAGLVDYDDIVSRYDGLMKSKPRKDSSYNPEVSRRISGDRGSHQKNEHAKACVNEDHSKTPVSPLVMHFKSSSSLPPLDRSTETFEPEKQRNLRNNLPMQDGPLHGVETDLGKAYDRSRPEGWSRYSRGNPIINSELDTGEPSRDALYDLREFPFHFATKPSSYVPSEPQHSNSSSPPHTSGSLAKKLTSMSEEEQERAVAELLQLSRVPEKRLSLCCKDILEALLPHLESTNMNVQVNSIKALVNFSIEKSNKVVILRAGAVPVIVKVLENGCPEAQEHAAGAAFSLALSDENKSPMGVLNIIPPLINLLDSGPIRAREDATMALYNLSLLHTNKSKLVKGGAIPILFNLAQSKETRPDLVSRVLMVLANAASIPEGKAALTQLNAIPALVRLLAIKSDRHADMIPEQAAAVLILLSKDYLRFVSIAVKAGAEELLTAMVEKGTTRGREKASRLLAIIKESLSEPDESDENSVLSRQYMRMKAEGGMMNSSAF